MRRYRTGHYEEVWGSPQWVENEGRLSAEHDVDVTKPEEMGPGEMTVDACEHSDDLECGHCIDCGAYVVEGCFDEDAHKGYD